MHWFVRLINGLDDELRLLAYIPGTCPHVLYSNVCSFMQEQNIVSEDEWSSFMSALRENLPATFRITGTRRCSIVYSSFWLLTYELILICWYYVLSQSCQTSLSMSRDHILQGHAWSEGWWGSSLTTSPSLLVSRSPCMACFSSTQSVEETSNVGQVSSISCTWNRKGVSTKRTLWNHDVIVFHIQGNLSRQEAVSMIPPLLLDVKPHHKVNSLQLCVVMALLF